MALLLSGPRDRTKRIVLAAASLVMLLLTQGVDFRTRAGQFPVDNLVISEGRFTRVASMPRPADQSRVLPVRAEFRHAEITFYGFRAQERTDLSIMITCTHPLDRATYLESPAMQEQAAALLRLRLDDLRAAGVYVGRVQRLPLPDSLSMVGTSGYGAAIAVGVGRVGSIGPWYGVAKVAEVLAWIALAICVLWFGVRRLIAGYLDRTFARLTRGRCPDCRYDLRSGGLTICPECGKDADATLAEAREIAAAINHQRLPWHASSGGPTTR